jgi:ornithine cyclodeaminase/alanine dehydrogenase-like protein (mu-crystallin family)
MTPLILDKSKILPQLSFARLIPILAEGFKDFHSGQAKVASITNIDVPEARGEMHIKPGYMTSGDHICVKIATCYYDNPAQGLPTRDGVLVLANRRNGRIEAILCDSGLITDMRTAGASAVAVDALAKPEATTLGLVGAGTQAYWHALAIMHVRPIERIFVWGRRAEKAKDLAERLAQETKASVQTESLETVAASDVVVTATPANAPILTDERISPGATIVAMGADAVGKRELGPGVLKQASLIVADSLKQCTNVGELQWPDSKTARIAELGAILAGSHKGRESPADIIVFDSTGVAFQDVVSASEVLRKVIA